MTERSLTEWLQRIENAHPTEIDLGLERVAAVAGSLDLPHPLPPAVVVAGTNGKGSVVAVMERLLAETGRRCGTYTSPHLLRFNERIRIAGQEASDEDIVTALGAVEAARGDTSLTYFETATLAALWLFRRARLDVLLLEVGLGGRLDAVNIVDGAVAVITSIDVDHQQWLGDDRGAIAREKAGILRAGRPAVVADPDPPPELVAALQASGCRGFLIGREFGFEQHDTTQAWFTGGDAGRLTARWADSGGLLPENCAAAVQALLALGVDVPLSRLAACLAEVSIPGRRQRFEREGVNWVFDVGHNPAGVKRLMEFLRRQSFSGRRIAVFSVMADKDIHAIIRACRNGFDSWLLMEQPSVKRAARAQDIAALLRGEGENDVATYDTPADALTAAQARAQPGDCVAVFGSFHTVGAALVWQGRSDSGERGGDGKPV